MGDPQDPRIFAHDFKNQLGIILGFLELVIAETPPDDPRLESLYEIRTAAHKCLALVDNRSDAHR